jgi:hypothetical protein
MPGKQGTKHLCAGAAKDRIITPHQAVSAARLHPTTHQLLLLLS